MITRVGGGNVELNLVRIGRRAVGKRVGVVDRFAQRTDAAVVGVGYQVTNHHPVFGELRRIAGRVARRRGDEVSAGNHRTERRREAGIAMGVGRHGGGAKIGLPLTVTGRIGSLVGEEFDAEGGAGQALQRTADRRAAAGAGYAGEDRSGLVVVRVVGAVQKDP